jgi:uncharacterized protein YecT (DUF1311 family)
VPRAGSLVTGGKQGSHQGKTGQRAWIWKRDEEGKEEEEEEKEEEKEEEEEEEEEGAGIRRP